MAMSCDKFCCWILNYLFCKKESVRRAMKRCYVVNIIVGWMLCEQRMM